MIIHHWVFVLNTNNEEGAYFIHCQEQRILICAFINSIQCILKLKQWAQPNHLFYCFFSFLLVIIGFLHCFQLHKHNAILLNKKAFIIVLQRRKRTHLSCNAIITHDPMYIFLHTTEVDSSFLHFGDIIPSTNELWRKWKPSP